MTQTLTQTLAQTLLRLPAVLYKRGRSRSSHYADIQQGLFTRPVLIGLRAVGWPVNEIAALNAARIAGRTDAEIRALVVHLESARKTADQSHPETETAPRADAPVEDVLARRAGAVAAGGEELYVPVTRKVSLKRTQKSCCAD